MLKTLEVRLVGVSPMLMHSTTTLDPTNPLTIAMDKIQKNKTLKASLIGQQQMSKLEWYAGLYVAGEGRIVLDDYDPRIEGKMQLVITGDMLESMITEGAKKTKKGKSSKAGVTCDGPVFGCFPLEYDGPADINKLYSMGNTFIDRRPVRIQQSRILRTRPRFNIWSLPIRVQYNESVISLESVVSALVVAGQEIGLSNYRPKFGRFVVEGADDAPKLKKRAV
jgi:hypothetical protein